MENLVELSAITKSRVYHVSIKNVSDKELWNLEDLLQAQFNGRLEFSSTYWKVK